MAGTGGSIFLLMLFFILFFLKGNASASASAATSLFGQRKLSSKPIDDDDHHQSTNLQVSPTVSPVNQSDTNPPDALKPVHKQNNKQSHLTDNNNNTKTLPDDTGNQNNNTLNSTPHIHNGTNTAGSKKDDDHHVKSSDLNTSVDNQNGTESAGKKEDDHVKSSDLNTSVDSQNGTESAGKKDDDHVKPSDLNTSVDNQNGTKSAGKKDDHVDPSASNGTRNDEGNGVEVNRTTQQWSSNNGSCQGSLISCRDKEMVACIEASKDGSKELFLLVLNEGENTLKVNVNVPDPSRSSLLVFEVPKHETKRMHIESANVGKSTNLLVNSENAKCRLPLVHPVSVDYYIQQLSFYSRQVTPIYGACTLFVLGILFGGTWACCKFRKKSRQDGIPYQELEMGLPQSVNVDDAGEGWDHDWDDDWDDENAVRSPGGNQVKSNISADGLTSRSPAKLDGWENDWDD